MAKFSLLKTFERDLFVVKTFLDLFRLIFKRAV